MADASRTNTAPIIGPIAAADLSPVLSPVLPGQFVIPGALEVLVENDGQVTVTLEVAYSRDDVLYAPASVPELQLIGAGECRYAYLTSKRPGYIRIRGQSVEGTGSISLRVYWRGPVDATL